MEASLMKDKVQRPDLADQQGTAPTEETHDEGEHKPQDSPGGKYTGEHGSSLPRPQKRDQPKKS